MKLLFEEGNIDLPDVEILTYVKTIAQKQLINAKLYSDRYEFVKTLKDNLTFLEIGSLAGDYAEYIIKEKNPKESFLVDVFGQDDCMYIDPELKLDNPRFSKNNHFPYFVNRFKKYNGVIYRGDCHKIMTKLSDNYFDFIYLDADHSLESVMFQLNQSARILAPNGIIGINDYCMGFQVEPYERIGTVPAVNLFLHHNPTWKVIGFALNDFLTSDIYLQNTNNNI